MKIDWDWTIDSTPSRRHGNNPYLLPKNKARTRTELKKLYRRSARRNEMVEVFEFTSADEILPIVSNRPISLLDARLAGERHHITLYR